MRMVNIDSTDTWTELSPSPMTSMRRWTAVSDLMCIHPWQLTYTKDSMVSILWPIFSARCNIYMSVYLWWKCIVVTGCNGSRISLHAWIDGCLIVFATYWQCLTRIIRWDDAGISGGRGGYWKIGNCSDTTYFTNWESGPETGDGFVYINDVYIFIIVCAEEFSLVISVENALYLKNGLC